MSQRDSGYERKERDLYETPEWVTLALLRHIPDRIKDIWEPACGSGKMVRALESAGFKVVGSDIEDGCDFFSGGGPDEFDAIITNPPYCDAEKFISKAVRISPFVAMLLRTDFDHAITRADLFERPSFAKKVVLRKRIRWIEGSNGSPSFNHAWFIWDWRHEGSPVLAYEPKASPVLALTE